ncbi:protein RDM16 isoform X2 [Diospyros lotus]|uniref:protein RDM16 isoform X2 n=1 Tax=Diospyros lotus TaxID=55363 RepID=UPI00225BBC36|nr:protein RDM16 isoform X2 [Diospyros lotus]
MDSKSGQKARAEHERDRDSTDEYKDSSRDREHKHCSSKQKSKNGADEDRRRHHHHHDSGEKHRSKHEKHRHRGGDDHRKSREYSEDRERSVEPRSQREGSRERVHGHGEKGERMHEPRTDREGSRERCRDHRDKREKSNEREGSRDRFLREESVERRHYKRKDRGECEDLFEGSEKRARFSNEVKDERKDRKERRQLEDRVVEDGDDKELNGGEKGERRERRRFEDGVKESEANEAKESRREEKRGRRKFEDRVKKEEMDIDEESKQRAFDEGLLEKEPKDEPYDDNSNANATNGDGSTDKVDALGLANGAFKTLPETSLAPILSPPTKVSSISTANENKGVNITGSHEVTEKSSTDGAASAGKSGNLSLDALAKAKRALQMQKELAEKLKKLPLSNKGATLDGTPQVASREVIKAPSSSSGLLPTPVSTSIFPAAPAASINPAASALAQQAGLTAPNLEAVKRAQELAAKMGFRQDPQFAPLINMFPGQLPPEVTYQPKPAKAPVLRLDALGREIDEHGNVVNTTKVTNLSTLKVNINKQKKDAFQILKPELDVDPETNPHFDARMGINSKKLLRPKRTNFQFVEEGKWSKEAEIIKLKSQFGEAQAKELKAKQAQLAKAKAEPDINPNLIEVSQRVITKEKPKEPIPEIEWWDQPLLQLAGYGDIIDGNVTEDKLRMEKITIYVEHPRPIEPPAEPVPPPPQPLKLTKKEQKKLRTQRRLAREKDRQEMIRQGLIEPPKPKVKMSNLMKVLGSEATQDPTRLEMEIKSAAAEREQAHIDRNIARKLTPDERREKKERKLFDDPNTMETIVSVYKINDLSHPQTRFKVDVNAQENRLAGCAVISDGMSIVVVEGGSKSIKRYGKLMLRRIDWASAVKNEEEDRDEDEDKPVNKCVLVWQGSVAKPSFNRFSVHECRTEAAAHKVFYDAGVGHYWDLAVNFSEGEM